MFILYTHSWRVLILRADATSGMLSTSISNPFLHKNVTSASNSSYSVSFHIQIPARGKLLPVKYQRRYCILVNCVIDCIWQSCHEFLFTRCVDRRAKIIYFSYKYMRKRIGTSIVNWLLFSLAVSINIVGREKGHHCSNIFPFAFPWTCDKS